MVFDDFNMHNVLGPTGFYDMSARRCQMYNRKKTGCDFNSSRRMTFYGRHNIYNFSNPLILIMSLHNNRAGIGRLDVYIAIDVYCLLGPQVLGCVLHQLECLKLLIVILKGWFNQHSRVDNYHCFLMQCCE